MPAPAQIKGLAATLRGKLAEAVARAQQIGERATSSVDNLHQVLDQADEVVADVDAAAADVQAAIGLGTNGGPALDPLPSSPTSSASSPGGHVEVTATGPVHRVGG